MSLHLTNCATNVYSDVSIHFICVDSYISRAILSEIMVISVFLCDKLFKFTYWIVSFQYSKTVIYTPITSYSLDHWTLNGVHAFRTMLTSVLYNILFPWKDHIFLWCAIVHSCSKVMGFFFAMSKSGSLIQCIDLQFCELYYEVFQCG